MTPKFTGVWIPAEVLGVDISLSAKVVYGVISGLDNENGCFASNGYLSAVLGLSERQIRNVLLELEDANLIYRYTPHDGKNAGEHRVIKTVEKVALCNALGEEENFRGGRKKTSTGGGRKLPTYSKKDNKEDINKEEPVKIDELPFSSAEFMRSWNLWIDYRKEIKKPLRKMSINPQFQIFKEWGEADSITSIKNSIANGWIGLFPVKKPYGQTQPKTLTAKDHNEF